jgi:hypothetical protein
MSEQLTWTIGAYDAEKRTVPVVFTKGDVVHDRTVNACHDGNGAYDADATADRVGEVARGVAVKIDLGVIVAQPEPVTDGDAAE